MIRLRYSPSSQELDLEGSRAELASLRDAIVAFCKSSGKSLRLEMDSAWDPGPYRRRLSALRLLRTKGLLQLTVDKDRLAVAGRPECLVVFAENLPCNAPHPPGMNYQLRFDAWGMEDYVSSESLGITLILRRGN